MVRKAINVIINQMKPLSQKDKRWAGEKLGFSNLSIGNYGCVIVSLAIMFDTDPLKINDYLKKHNGFKEARVIWAKIPGFVSRNWQYNNIKVKEAIKKYGACMVQTDFDGNPRTEGDHYVVFTGNHRLLDPWLGKERKTSVYPLLKGFIIFNINKGRQVFQNAPLGGSNEDLAACLDQHRKLMAVIKRNDKKIENLEKTLEHNEVVRKALAKSNQELLSNLQETENSCKEIRAKFLSEQDKLKSEIKALTKENKNWQSALESSKVSWKNCEGRKKNLRQEILDLKKEKQDNKRRYEARGTRDIKKMPVGKLLVYLVKKVLRIKNV